MQKNPLINWHTLDRQMVELKWIRQFGGSDKIVWSDVQKLDLAWQGDPVYIRPGQEDERYLRFASWILRPDRPRLIQMPHICVEDGKVIFTDGTHRFAWCRNHGALAIPVTLSRGSQARDAQKLLGCELRVTQVSMPEPIVRNLKR